ncbi:hypothetical protein GCK72_025333 [Caenorhabditis remanei]|uniref:Uncharacterized protein n=1 Tax=Caenorhabditis remanei TaxID=31234 RepID=A0A6A5G1P8_CAERE|nr:hypothetical protein GCK72_025333 [Caenorhabditis remanei]KAF1748866.1 hypothetical protein GCK72_025333 [Caenorhabditis remanei]
MSDLEQQLQEMPLKPKDIMEFSSNLNEQVQTPDACVQNNDKSINEYYFQLPGGTSLHIIYDDSIFYSNVFELHHQAASPPTHLSYSETHMCWYHHANFYCWIKNEIHNWTLQQAGTTCEMMSTISTSTF